MFDVALLARALNAPGRSAPDGAVNSLVQLTSEGDHRRAAERAADLLADGYTDVRIACTFLLGAFEERGPASLPEIVGALADTLSQRWAVLRPEARRERAVDTALSFLFRSIKALIDFHETTRGPAWTAWAERITTELPSATQTAVAALRSAVHVRIDDARCLGELAGVNNRASDYFNKHPPAEPKPLAPLVPEPEPATDTDTDTDHEPAAQPEPNAEPKPVTPAPPASPASAPAEPSPAPGARTIEVSPALEAFLRKLEAFELLLQRKDMARAAIVAQDIRTAVDHFDPRVYLPKLLTPHFRLMSAHAADLAPYWEPTHASEALTQLYQVDIDAFLEP